MGKTRIFASLTAVLAAGVLAAACTTSKADMKPAGGPDSVAFAKKLWAAMGSAGYVGANMINGTPYEGQEPHGAVLETMDGMLKVDGRTALVVVKRNYGPKGLDTDAVMNEPGKHLKAVTVMYKREKGYDPDNADWFWVKYKADGSLDVNPKGVKLAGWVMKGADKGCIACHKGAGADMLFTRDR